MDLGPYVESIQSQLEVAAEAGGEEARALAERLVAPLDAAIRLALQDALAAAAEEITSELAPGSVELRLRGREPEFVVTLPPADPPTRSRRGRRARPARPAAARGRRRHDVAGSTFACPSTSRRGSSRRPRATGSRSTPGSCELPPPRSTEPMRPVDAERRAPQGAQRYSGWAR